MAPSVLLTIWATPELPLPAWTPAGHVTVEPVFSVQVPSPPVPSDLSRKVVKLLVVPELSERTATTIGLLGKVTPALSAATAGSFHVVILPWKMLAMVAGLSCSLSTPLRLYDIVIGATTTGK